MLKSSKIIIFCIGGIALAAGSYFAFFNGSGKKVVVQKNKIKKQYSTEPRVDSNLNKLNQILSDNKEAMNTDYQKGTVVLETYENIDKNSSLYDSLVQAGLVKDVNANEPAPINRFGKDDVLKADRMLAKQNVKIIGGKGTTSDSLASSLADVKVSSKQQMTIEFWESPVNYKGYRLGKDKMIVFGVIPSDVKLVMHEGEMYLITINNIYQVKPCSDFCKLQPIKDQRLLTSIMRHVN